MSKSKVIVLVATLGVLGVGGASYGAAEIDKANTGNFAKRLVSRETLDDKERIAAAVAVAAKASGDDTVAGVAAGYGWFVKGLSWFLHGNKGEDK